MRREKCLYSWNTTIDFHIVSRIENLTNGRFPGVPTPLNCWNTHEHFRLLIFTFLLVMWSQFSGNECQTHLASSKAKGGGHNLPLPNVINHAYSQSIIFSLDVWGHRSTVYWETISDHGPNTNKAMIFALEILLLSGKLSLLDYLEVSYAKYSVFDMGLGWQYQKKVNILLYFW